MNEYRLGGSLKTEGFGDGGRKSHPQAALEAATLSLIYSQIHAIEYKKSEILLYKKYGIRKMSLFEPIETWSISVCTQ